MFWCKLVDPSPVADEKRRISWRGHKNQLGQKARLLKFSYKSPLWPCIWKLDSSVIWKKLLDVCVKMRCHVVSICPFCRVSNPNMHGFMRSSNNIVQKKSQQCSKQTTLHTIVVKLTFPPYSSLFQEAEHFLDWGGSWHCSREAATNGHLELLSSLRDIAC